ncbi:uncharacterized protein A1O9_08409 [Exophiala aquamarina CBS 119918]|uniref:NmrA-like domain-containing protein n=1 Tax=Exophiala aquamarina CBS 119918 TaxID=1182545 RepID=A0A072P6B5_9EURO|nr:uncharacterized protein A1O9_08409 [Exophiala aquamarina CBS 119918]KEF55659.1 hypothetical protein A1O9_08409 [Exophiala aquamarina CBS 119918]
MSSLPVVSIVGGSGHLGQHIVRAFLEPTRKSQFKEIRVVTRNGGSSTPQEFAQQGASVLTYDENALEPLVSVLKDSDIVINMIGVVLKAMQTLKARLYFPSDSGVDPRLHDFSNPEWDAKRLDRELVSELLPSSTCTCSVYPGLFLEHSIGPWYGLSSRAERYEQSGAHESKIRFTSLPDIGRSVVDLSLLPEPPEHVHLAGDTKAIIGVARTMESAVAGPIEVVETDLDKYKKDVLTGPGDRPEKNLRFLVGEGKIDHSDKGLGNDNEIVNPGQKRWGWWGLCNWDLA